MDTAICHSGHANGKNCRSCGKRVNRGLREKKFMVNGRGGGGVMNKYRNELLKKGA